MRHAAKSAAKAAGSCLSCAFYVAFGLFGCVQAGAFFSCVCRLLCSANLWRNKKKSPICCATLRRLVGPAQAKKKKKHGMRQPVLFPWAYRAPTAKTRESARGQNPPAVTQRNKFLCGRDRMRKSRDRPPTLVVGHNFSLLKRIE
nr:Morn repeat domain containing protein [Pandoravirus aubagnensis]